MDAFLASSLIVPGYCDDLETRVSFRICMLLCMFGWKTQEWSVYSNNTEQSWQLYRLFQLIQLVQEKNLWRLNISKVKSKAIIFQHISGNWSLDRLIMEINNFRSVS